MKLCPACRKVELTPLRRGGFFCEECGQRFDAALKSFDRGRVTAMAPVVAWDDPTLPFSIAHPLSRARDVRSPLATRFEEAANGAYEVIRTVGLLLLSDYLASTAKSRRVAVAVRALRAPDWWAWTVLNNQLCRFWSGELDVPPDRETAFPKVTAGWRSVNKRSAAKKDSRWGTLLEGLPGRSGSVAQSANDALWRAREEADRVRRGEGDPPSEDQLKKLLGVIDSATARLFPRNSVEIVRRLATPVDKAHLVRLHGAHPDLSFGVEIKEREWGVPFGVSPVIAVTRDATVPLYPLFLRFDGATRHATLPTGGLLEPLCRDGARARLVPRAGSTEVVASSTLAALRRRDADMLASSHEIVPSTLAQFAAGMVDVAAGELAMRGADGGHVVRAGVDDVAEEALRTAGRALLIVGPSGVGKTTLAARLALSLARLSTPPAAPVDVDRAPLAETVGDLVVFLSGRNAYAGPDGEPVALTLKRTILRRLGVRDDAFVSLHHFFSAIEEHGAAAEGRRVVLVLDAVDEADDFEGIIAALDDVLPALSHHPSVRLCITMRTASFRALGRGRGPRALDNASQLLSFQNGRGDGLVPYLEMRPFTAEELARAYAARRARTPALPELAQLSDDERGLLSLPLHLSLFADGWPSTRGAIDTARLFAGFFARKRAALPELDAALAEIGQALVRRRTYDLLGVVRMPSKRKGTLAPRVPSLVEPAALVEAGVLRRPEDDGRDGPLPFAFAHPSIGDEVVLAALGLTPGVPSGEDLLRAGDLAATTPTDAFPAVSSALSVLVERLARAGEGATLGWLLGGEDAASSEHLLSVALTSLGAPLAEGGAAAERAKKTIDEVSSAALSDPRFAARLVNPLRHARVGLLASGHVSGAIAIERAALRIVRARIADAPGDGALQIGLASSLAELLRLAIVDEDWALARKLAHDATRLGESGLASQPEDPELAASVAESFLLAAEVFVHDGRVKEARRALGSAAQISSAASTPHLRARALGELAGVAVREGNLAEARAVLESALSIERALVATGTMKDAEIRTLAATLKRLGDVELASGLGRDARRRWEDAVSALRAVVAREPYFLGAATDLFATLRRLGNLARTEGRREEARRALDEAIEGATFLASQPGVRPRVEAELALALHDAGVLAFLEGKRGRATKLLAQAIEIASRLAGRSGDDELAHARASAIAHLGHVARAEGKRREARSRFDEALADAPLPGPREDRALDLANIHLAAAEVADSATMKNAHLLDARSLLEPYAERPSAGRLLELVRRAERSSLRAMSPRRIPWLALSLALSVVALDVARRPARLRELGALELSAYASSVALSAAFWCSLSVAGLGPTSARLGFRALFIVLATALIGGQLYFHDNFSAYIDDNAIVFGMAFSKSVTGQLRADLGNLIRAHLGPLVASVALVVSAGALVRVSATHAKRAQLAFVGFALLEAVVPCVYAPRQAALPDVLYVHALGTAVRAKLGLLGAKQSLPGEHSPEFIPTYAALPARPRNVLFVLTESVRRDMTCDAGSPCEKTPFTHRAAPDRAIFTQMRANDSTTAISVGVLFTGLPPSAPRDAIHHAPMLWELAKAGGYDTAYFTSQDLRFGNSDMFIRHVPVSRKVSGAELDRDADIDLGAHDRKATSYALRELATMKEPFFAVVHLSNTHFPYRIDEGDEPFQPAEFTKDPAKNDAFRRHFQNAVHAQDKVVGELVAGVRASAYGDRTVVVFTSDHGEAFREHGQLGHTLSVFDEEILVPAWIDAPPARLSPDESKNLTAALAVPVFHTDVVPTLLDLMGVLDLPETSRFRARMPGRSLLRPYEPYVAPLTNCSELWTCPFKSWGVMRGHKKLEARQWDNAFHCFDLSADPREQHDLGEPACGDLSREARAIFGTHPNGRLLGLQLGAPVDR